MTSYCILIADHDKASSDLVRSTLAADGYNTNIAASSRDAITSAAITQPQLLLINPALLQPSGIEAAKQIHLSTHCKVLFLSPVADEPFFRAVLAGLQQQGCESSALRVPFTAEELLSRVKIELGPHSSPQQQNPPQVSGQPEYSARPAAFGAALSDNDGLLAMMQPHLYTLNAFRVTGLDVDASPRDMARQAEKLEMLANAGVEAQGQDAFALGSASPEQIQAAKQLLKIPEQRLLQEFFWFWPITPDSKADDALLALHRGEPRLAESVWTAAGVVQRELESVQILLDARCSEAEQATLLARKSNLERAKAGSIHNLAILHHLYALRLETGRKADLLGQHAERLSEWKKAFAFWSLLRNQHSFWELLTERIRALEEPRLTIAVQMIWNSLPLGLLSINAELAATAVKEQNFEAALEHRQIMKASAFGPDSITQALHTGLSSLTEELARLCDNAEASSRANPSSGFPTVRRLLAEANRYLRGLRSLLDTGDSMRAEAHDMIVQSARTCLWACANKTQDWHVAQPLFQECFNLAESNSLRFSLRQDLETIADKIAAQQDRTYAHSTSAMLEEPDHNKRGITAGSVIVLAAVALISLFVMLDRRPPSEHPGAAQANSAATPMQTSAPQEPSPLASVPSPRPSLYTAAQTSRAPSRPPAGSASAVNLSSLRRSITHNTTQLNGMEPALANLKERLAVLQYAIADGASPDRTKGVADVATNDAKPHDSSLVAYNSLTRDYVAMVQRYKGLAQSTNAQIASYNSLVTSQLDRLPSYRTKW